jgi:hypothetical protein
MGRLAHQTKLIHDKNKNENHRRAEPPIDPAKLSALFEVP